MLKVDNLMALQLNPVKSLDKTPYEHILNSVFIKQ